MLKKLGKYELIQSVGRGAMGEVYKAHDPLIGRLVAIKTINSSLVGDPKLLERFYQEARSAGTLQHANIVTIYELGADAETPFIAMEFLEGSSLDKLIAANESLSLAQKVSYLIAICRALDYAHKRGVIHRDIKPANVMVANSGRITVVDFGIARLADRGQTQTGAMIGTIPYMSPEQLRGEHADERSDIWALGITAYELLCGHRPFDAENYAQLMMNIVDEARPTPPLQNQPSGCPTALETLIARMLRRNRAERIPTAEEVLLGLESIWKDVREAEVSGLTASAEEMIRSGDTLGARDVLRRALQLDGASEPAKTLLEQVHAELRKSRVNPQILDILDRGKTLLREGRIPDAVAAGESALKLDSNFTPTKEFIADVHRAAALSRATPAPSGEAARILGPVDATQTTEGFERGATSSVGVRPSIAPQAAGSPGAKPESRIGSHGRESAPAAGKSPTQAKVRRSAVLIPAAIALLILVPGAALWIHSRNLQRANAALQHAEQLESQKEWPQALSEYNALAAGGSAVAAESQQKAENLKKLLDEEVGLWNQAEQTQSSGDIARAVSLYQEVAALHGDKEEAAAGAVAKLAAARSATAATGPRTKPGIQSCQLLAPDLPQYLDMADRNRAEGKYADAEREYRSVLVCDPRNARARAGLVKTRKATAVPSTKPAD